MQIVAFAFALMFKILYQKYANKNSTICICSSKMCKSKHLHFHIFDTETRELTRVENTNKLFKKIIYNDKETNYDELNINQFDKCFVKLYISNKSDNDMFERLMDRLYNSINIHAIDVIEDPTDIGASVREDILEQGEDTLTFLGNYIDQTDIKLDKQKLKQFAKELYMEASE